METIIPFGIKYKEEFLSGREEGIKEALRKGFKPDSFKEIVLEWRDMDANVSTPFSHSINETNNL